MLNPFTICTICDKPVFSDLLPSTSFVCCHGWSHATAVVVVVVAVLVVVVVVVVVAVVVVVVVAVVVGVGILSPTPALTKNILLPGASASILS